MNKTQRSSSFNLTEGRVVTRKKYSWMVTEFIGIIIHDLVDNDEVGKIPPISSVNKFIGEFGKIVIMHLGRLLLLFKTSKTKLKSLLLSERNGFYSK